MGSACRKPLSPAPPPPYYSKREVLEAARHARLERCLHRYLQTKGAYAAESLRWAVAAALDVPIQTMPVPAAVVADMAAEALLHEGVGIGWNGRRVVEV